MTVRNQFVRCVNWPTDRIKLVESILPNLSIFPSFHTIAEMKLARKPCFANDISVPQSVSNTIPRILL